MKKIRNISKTCGKDYLKSGYYPFLNETDYMTRLNNIIPLWHFGMNY